MTPAFQEEILTWALKYAARGWKIFPCHTVTADRACTCGDPKCSAIGKHPRTARGLKDASDDKAQVEKWFGADSEPSNVAIVTGELSGLTVLDVDIGPGKCGGDTWADLIRERGEPPTLKAETGGGGVHLFFHYNSALKTATNVLGRGVDCRNDRGYVIAAPSVHKSGGRYEWVEWDTAQVLSLPAHLSQRKETRGRPRKDDPLRWPYTVDQVRKMLECVPADDRDLWRNVGVILGREFTRSDEAWTVYVEWAAKWTGVKGRGHDETMRAAFYDISQQASERELSIGTIVKAAMANGWVPTKGEVPIGQFVYYLSGNTYIYRTTIAHCIAAAVDAVVAPVNVEGKLIKASAWLQTHQLVTSITCDPQFEDDYVKGFDCRDGELIEAPGAALFNTYRRPTIALGEARLAVPFVDHCHRLFDKPGDADQFLDFMAHRRQRPWEKPRFALLIAGGQGIGKDTAVEFCCPAIGDWNVVSIDPGAFDTAFNEYVAATLVRISETSNLHEMSKWAFNERTKVLIAGAPDMCVVNQKYGEKFTVRMHCGVILTTNNLASGIYIPQDDRRYDVIECATLEAMGLKPTREEQQAAVKGVADVAVPLAALEKQYDEVRRKYFDDLWGWFHNDGGKAHVAAFLADRDLTHFSPNHGQRKTAAHRDVVQANLASDEWLIDVLDGLGDPTLVRADWIMARAEAQGEKQAELRRKLGPTMGRAGYVVYRNPRAQDGRWTINGRNRWVWAKAGTPPGLDVLKECAKDVF